MDYRTRGTRKFVWVWRFFSASVLTVLVGGGLFVDRQSLFAETAVGESGGPPRCVVCCLEEFPQRGKPFGACVADCQKGFGICGAPLE